MTPPHFLRLYAGFAAAYLLSYVFRTVNAVISPDLSADLGISASSLGLLTSAYFLAFAAMQLPAGMMLDRYGPRRVEPVLLAVAGCGALAFAASDNLSGLAFARALIGAGCRGLPHGAAQGDRHVVSARSGRRRCPAG